jgi:hypothetical protein
MAPMSMEERTDRLDEDAPLTTLVVAGILKCSPDLVRNAERAGQLRARRTSSGIRLFDRVDVERFREVRAKRAAQRAAQRAAAGR